MDINNSNKVLAKFLGWTQGEGQAYTDEGSEDWFFVPENVMTKGKMFQDSKGTMVTVSEMKFTTDWDWLMPVVEKIETLSHVRGRYYYLHKEAAYVQIRVDRIVHQPLSRWGTSGNQDVKMAIYRACVQFVNNYIETPKP